MAPVLRDLGGLEVEVIYAGKCRGYVGTQGLKSLGKSPSGTAPLLGLRALWVSDSVMWGLPCVPLCVGGEWNWTLYLYDRNLEMSA